MASAILFPIRSYRQIARGKVLHKPSPSSLGNVKFSEYEQSGDDEATRVRVHDALDSESVQVQAELKELEDELAILREGPFGPNSEFMQSFPPEEREEILKALEEEGVHLEADEELLTPEELDQIARAAESDKLVEKTTGPLKVTLGIPTKDRVYVKRFNLALQEAEGVQGNARPYLSLWKWYLRCQQQVSNFGVILPEEVWHFLWKTQSNETNFRSRHLQMLAKDMTKAEVSLADEEWLQYIHALQTGGNISLAAQTWDSQKTRMGMKEKVALDFWMLGVKLYVALERPQKAQRLALECYGRTGTVDPEPLVAVITAWAQTRSLNAEERAWACYLELRKRLETRETEDETLSTLGRISSILLENGRQQLALAVFKDMFMLRARSPTDSWKVFKTVSKKMGNTESASEDQVSKIGLASLAFLPKSFHNKFFFGSWIKWLLGEGQVDEAALIVELMYERGIRPDARHLNGIIAAWLRDGSPTAAEKAESTAWAMVRARIEMVRDRNREGGKTLKPLLLETTGQVRKVPAFLQRGAPPATIETFSILMVYYNRRSNATSADFLSRTMMGPAEMNPNSFIMNHWMYASLRSGDIPEVWKTYTAFKPRVQPDLETYAALWDTAKVHFGSPAAHLDNVPSPRHLFKEMVEWHAGLNRETEMRAREEFSTELYEQIIRCFCFTSDLEGTLCALHGLHQTFDVLPHEDINRLIIMQVARSFPSVLGPAEQARLRRRRGPLRVRGSHLKVAVKAVTEIVMAIMEKKINEQDLDPDLLKDTDPDDEEEDEDDDGDEESFETPVAQALRLDVLTSFLCMVLERRSLTAVSTTVFENKDTVEVATPMATTASNQVHASRKNNLAANNSPAETISTAAEEMNITIPAEVLTRRDWADIRV
ncbi:uncharacterized protein A1O9_04846 [Exophiala aquamarina CBS 119918]|uniref:Pentatricopeptide repeat domain-containing protein n=1 Tax=Exophiala aquamarina CBS 119918 TaxID=1182545 RepID=A0A072PJQ8_9EURO|nr:uncharacterized protein A1O9_04846 [Exophiala aquamarina CBS 119918]KEF59997.1 hypothetical protein A1O9_04846 [Exophiala aquamarina CBS 119918]